MDIFWSLLSIIIGVITVFYSYKDKNLKNKSGWDKVMYYRGYAGGMLFVIIGIVTLIKGWSF